MPIIFSDWIELRERERGWKGVITDPGKVTLTQFDLDDVPYAPSSYNSLSRGPSYSHVPTTPHSHSATPTDCDGDSETVELGA